MSTRRAWLVLVGKVPKDIIVIRSLFLIGLIRWRTTTDLEAGCSQPAPCTGATLGTMTPTKQPFVDPRLSIMRESSDSQQFIDLTMGWINKFPCASTAPVPLLRRHMPGVPVEGGALADGTRIRHWFGHLVLYAYQIRGTNLIEIVVQLGTEFIDNGCNFVGQSEPHSLQLVKRSLLTGNQGNYKRSQRPVMLK